MSAGARASGEMRYDLVVVGLSLSSSWGNGHATTYRALLRALAARGRHVLFLECDRPWYASHRDEPSPEYCDLAFYDRPEDLERFRAAIAGARAVIVGSYVQDGIETGARVQRMATGRTAFYDIDTPITLAALARGDCAYVSPDVLAGYDAVLSFAGGPTLDLLRERYGVRAPHAFYCSVDPSLYAPTGAAPVYELGYLGTWSADRQPGVERLLIDVARRLPDRRFVVAGPQYPAGIAWPENVERIEHVPPAEHALFYNRCRFTLNVTRDDMKRAGWSPSVRLFEAAAVGTPIVSDDWDGLASLFEPGREIAIARSTDDVVSLLRDTDEPLRLAMANAARARVLAAHTADHRAASLEEILALD